MASCIASAIFLLVASEIPADRAGEFFRQCHELRADGVRLLQQEVKVTEQSIVLVKRSIVNKKLHDKGVESQNGRMVYRDQKDRDEVVEGLKARIEQLKENAAAVEAGKLAMTPHLTSKRLQVGAFGAVKSLKVEQVIDAESFRSSVGGVDVWVSGVSTEGHVDGSRLKTEDSIFEVVGTRSYATALGGKRTVFEIQLVHARDLNDHKPAAVLGILPASFVSD